MLTKRHIHEAGHAVACAAAGRKFSVIFAGEQEGYVDFPFLTKHEREQPELLDREAVCAMAGEAAEQIALGSAGVAAGDTFTAAALLMLLGVHPNDLPWMICEYVGKAATLLREHRGALERLAGALEQKGQLDYKAALEVTGFSAPTPWNPWGKLPAPTAKSIGWSTAQPRPVVKAPGWPGLATEAP